MTEPWEMTSATQWLLQAEDAEDGRELVQERLMFSIARSLLDISEALNAIRSDISRSRTDD